MRKLGESKLSPVETVDSLTEKIKELKKQHAKDIEHLFRFQRSEYHQELIDHRICHDVLAYMDLDEAYPDQVEFKKALEVCVAATRFFIVRFADADASRTSMQRY